MKFLQFVVLFFVIILFLPGCWSSKEIEELALNVGVAIDPGDEQIPANQLDENRDTYSKENILSVTYQYLIHPSDAQNQGSNQARFENTTVIGDLNHQMLREIALKKGDPIMLHHTKVIVINGKLLKETSLEEILDYFLRDNEMRPSCLLLISSVPAYQTLESASIDVVPAFQLIDISDNVYRTNKIISPVTLAKVEGKMFSGFSYLLQNIYAMNGNRKYSGAAVIKGKTNKLVGSLNEDEVVGINLISGEAKGGVLKSQDEEGKVISYEIKELKSRIIPVVKGDDISFEIKLKSKGRISEDWFDQQSSSDKFLKKAKLIIRNEIGKAIESTLSKTQKEFKVDVIGCGKELSIKYPKVWDSVKDNWDELFAELPITYNINLEITDYGTKVY
ncbi:Ger(x)C family spore germination protein [Cytobacillus sp. FJAT-53684]|uniref:Ger(X)C family spore germination protein n=1 Tax=Cytobacillus mangrovibacter TaxID=3299024 RepID=A0ABW6JXF8_9BACI